jgi:hypothetical protein
MWVMMTEQLLTADFHITEQHQQEDDNEKMAMRNL